MLDWLLDNEADPFLLPGFRSPLSLAVCRESAPYTRHSASPDTRHTPRAFCCSIFRPSRRVTSRLPHTVPQVEHNFDDVAKKLFTRATAGSKSVLIKEEQKYTLQLAFTSFLAFEPFDLFKPMMINFVEQPGTTLLNLVQLARNCRRLPRLSSATAAIVSCSWLAAAALIHDAAPVIAGGYAAAAAASDDDHHAV